MQRPRWLLGACLWLLCSTEVWMATFKLALIGPWSCDPLFSRAMPTAAANLALSRLRSDTGLSRGYWYDVKLLDEDCSASKGSVTIQSLSELSTNQSLSVSVVLFLIISQMYSQFPDELFSSCFFQH